MQAVGGKTVRRVGSPGGEGVDAAGAVIAAKSAPCEVVVADIACRAISIAPAEASAEPVPPSEGKEKIEVKRCQRHEKILLRLGWWSTNLSQRAERSSILIPGLCARKSRRSEEANGRPSNPAFSGPAASYPKPTPGVGEKRG